MCYTLSRKRGINWIQYIEYTRQQADLEKSIGLKNRVAENFTGFTVFTGTGYWKGRREGCLVIEILANAKDRDDVLRIASWIKTTFRQESVAITESPVKLYIVGKSL